MVKQEIVFPNLELPDLNELTGFGWARLPRVYTQWLKSVCPQLQLNTNQLVLAEMIDRITGDDGNSIPGWFKQDKAVYRQRNLFERMDWEIGEPEMPNDVKDRLRELKIKLKNLDWWVEGDYSMVRTQWFAFRDWMRGEAKTRQKFKQALSYSRQKGSLIEPHWEEFLHLQGPTL